MTTLDTIAMCIGYFVMFIIALIVFVIMPIAAIGRHHAERNARIYDEEIYDKEIKNLIDNSNGPGSN